MANAELITSVDYKSGKIMLNAGDNTYGKGLTTQEKARMLSDFPAWFTTYTDLEVAADVAEAAAQVAEAKAAASLARTTAAEEIYTALKVISDADDTAAGIARTAADDAATAAGR
jgi:hypothetical protein